MKRVLSVLALPILLGFSAPASAQSGSQCAAIGEDGERLACYDGLFQNGAAAGEFAGFVIESEQLIPARPSGRAPATLSVSCEADVLQVAFRFAGNTMSISGNEIGLTLQNDLQRSRSSTLPVDNTNTAILIDNSRDARAFLDGLVGTNNLNVRVTPATTRSLNVRFNVSTLNQDVAPFIAACG